MEKCGASESRIQEKMRRAEKRDAVLNNISTGQNKIWRKGERLVVGSIR